MIDEKYSIAFEYIGKEVTPVGAPRGMGGMLAGLLAGALFRGRGRAMKSTPKAMPKAQAAPKAAPKVDLRPDEAIDYVGEGRKAAARTVSSPGMKRTIKPPKVKSIPFSKEQISENVLKGAVEQKRKELIKKNNELKLAPVAQPEAVAANKAEPVKLEGINDKIFVSEMKKLTENIKNQEKVGDK